MVNPGDFEKLVERKIDFITTDTIFRAWSSEKIYEECTGFAELATRKSAFINFKYYTSHDDIERVEQLAAVQGVGKFARYFSEKGERYGKDALACSNQIRKKNWKSEATAELLEVLKKFDKKALRAIAFTWPTHPIALAVEGKLREVLQGKMQGKGEVDNALTILSFPTRENTPVIESRELTEISREIAKLSFKPAEFSQLPEKIKQKFHRHVEKFGFLGARGVGLKRWNTGDFYKRSVEMAGDKTIVKKLEKTGLKAGENREETEKIEKQLLFSLEQRELVESAKLLVWFRTYRTEVMYRIYSDIEPLLEEIGKRFSYSLEEMQFLSTGEILSLEKTKPAKNLITQRQQGFAVLLENETINTMAGKDREKLEKLFEEKTTASEVRGTVACRGKVKGRVKIVLTSRELDKVKQGDILITSMTTPDFIPAMQRAAAFVTNEGGITCHAAIVSREMNKPCVIATKMATRVFKDGDTVEVDAENGIVRKVG